MRRSTSRPRSGACAAPVLKNRAPHSDRDATEGPKRCDHSCRRPHLGAFRCKLLGHSDIRACCGTNPFTYPPGSYSSASSQASATASASRVPARQWPFARRRLLLIVSGHSTRQNGRRNCVGSQMRPLQLMVQGAQKEASKLLLQLLTTH